MKSKGPHVNGETYKRDMMTCLYCGLNGLSDFDNWRQLSIDHLIPQTLGGDDSSDNLVTCCKRCNELKRKWDPRRDKTISQPQDGGLRSKMIEMVKNYLSASYHEDYKDWVAMRKELGMP
jgi:hypothetical protein